MKQYMLPAPVESAAGRSGRGDRARGRPRRAPRDAPGGDSPDTYIYGCTAFDMSYI